MRGAVPRGSPDGREQPSTAPRLLSTFTAQARESSPVRAQLDGLVMSSSPSLASRAPRGAPCNGQPRSLMSRAGTHIAAGTRVLLRLPRWPWGAGPACWPPQPRGIGTLPISTSLSTALSMQRSRNKHGWHDRQPLRQRSKRADSPVGIGRASLNQRVGGSTPSRRTYPHQALLR